MAVMLHEFLGKIFCLRPDEIDINRMLRGEVVASF